MPTSVIAAVIGYAVSGAVATAAGSLFVGAIAGAVASMAINAAFAKSPATANDQPLTQTLTDNLVTVRQPISNWQYIYGRTRVSGALTFAHESADQMFHLIVTFAGHACHAIEAVHFNDEVVPLDGDGNATGKYAGYVRIQKSLGDEAGQPFADLVSESEGKWTDAYRQSGRTKIYVRLNPSADLFPTGIPNITAVIQGKKVYDPRTTTVHYSDNASLCEADFVCDKPAGLEAVYADEIDDAELIAAANLDDELMSIVGGTEKRYTLNGAFLVNSTPGDVLGKMLTANNGKVRYIGGLFRVQPAGYVTPTITISDNDCRAVPHIIPRLSATDLCNGVKGLYISEDNLWQPSDFPAVVNATYLAEDGGERSWLELTLPFTKSAATAQRIAKIELERRRQQITVEWKGKFTCYRLQAGNTVMLTFPMMGWTAKVFEVAQTSLAFEDDDSGGIRLGADLLLRETAAGVYDWDSGEETAVDLAPNTNLPDPFAVTPPTDLVLSDAPLILVDGTVIPRIAVSWTPSGYAFTIGWEVRFRIQGDALWQTQTVTDPTAILQPLSVGDLYDIEIYTLTPLGKSQTALTASGHAVAGQVNAPPAATSLSAVGGMFCVVLTWAVDAGARRDISYTEVWAATANNRAAAARITTEPWPAQSYKHVGLAPGVNWYYWTRVVDTSKNRSAYFPLSATAGVVGTPSTDPSALLTQLINSVGLGQMVADLATPITLLIGPDNIELAGAGVLGQIQSLAEAALKASVDTDKGRSLAQGASGRLTIAQRVLEQHSDAISAEASERLLLVAQIGDTAAAVVDEANARVDADGAIAGDVTIIAARLDTGDYATVKAQSSATASALGVAASVITALSARLDTGDFAAVKTESSATASALGTAASDITAISARLNTGDFAAVKTESSATASALGTAASDITTITARLDTGDYAAVKTESSATASAVGVIQAKYAVKVDVAGHVTGVELINDGTVGSFIILADKFLIAKPDGTGTPVQVLVLGMVDGVSTLGLNGNMIIDGSIVARHLAAGTLVVDDASVGTLKIAGHAITVSTVGSFSGTSAVVYGGAGWADIINVPVTFGGVDVGGGDAHIVASFMLDNISTINKIEFKLTRIDEGGGAGDLLIQSGSAYVAGNQSSPVAFSVMDTPGAGDYSYTLAIQTSVITNATVTGCNVIITEYKR